MKTLKITLSLIVLIALAYCGAWYFMAREISTYVDQYYTVDGPAEGIIFYGDKPVLSGFPFAPTLTYKDGFEKNNVLVYFDELTLSGFPIPYTPMTIKARDNIKMVNQNIKVDIEADKIDLTFLTPPSFPQNTIRENIARWQEQVGKIDITEANFIAGDVNIQGKGFIGLDKNLQLNSGFKTKTYGYEEAIQFFIEAGTVKPLVGSLTIAGLNSLAQVEEGTGKNFVELDIAVANQQMFFGPIKIDDLPPITWR
jgi:hypothetical protein